MALHLIVANETAEDLDETFVQRLREAARHTVAEEGLPAELEIGLTLADDGALQQLNEQYRGVDEATDVLSFPLFERDELERFRMDPAAFPERPALLGDVVISLPTARRQAVEYGHSLLREVVFLFVHGLLHLLGYDHDEEGARRQMRAREEAILYAVGLPREGPTP